MQIDRRPDLHAPGTHPAPPDGGSTGPELELLERPRKLPQAWQPRAESLPAPAPAELPLAGTLSAIAQSLRSLLDQVGERIADLRGQEQLAPDSDPAVSLPSSPDTQALANVQQAVEQRLAQQAFDAKGFDGLLRQAFGEQIDAGQAAALREQLRRGDSSWLPHIEVVSSRALADLSGQQGQGQALGAYAQASHTIYLSRELLHADPAAAEQVLMEEIGHAIDARLNLTDTQGDEGELFARLMRGDTLSVQERQALQAENDHGQAQLQGQARDVEYSWRGGDFEYERYEVYEEGYQSMPEPYAEPYVPPYETAYEPSYEVQPAPPLEVPVEAFSRPWSTPLYEPSTDFAFEPESMPAPAPVPPPAPSPWQEPGPSVHIAWRREEQVLGEEPSEDEVLPRCGGEPAEPEQDWHAALHAPAAPAPNSDTQDGHRFLEDLGAEPPVLSSTAIDREEFGLLNSFSSAPLNLLQSEVSNDGEQGASAGSDAERGPLQASDPAAATGQSGSGSSTDEAGQAAAAQLPEPNSSGQSMTANSPASAITPPPPAVTEPELDEPYYPDYSDDGNRLGDWDWAFGEDGWGGWGGGGRYSGATTYVPVDPFGPWTRAEAIERAWEQLAKGLPPPGAAPRLNTPSIDWAPIDLGPDLQHVPTSLTGSDAGATGGASSGGPNWAADVAQRRNDQANPFGAPGANAGGSLLTSAGLGTPDGSMPVNGGSWGRLWVGAESGKDVIGLTGSTPLGELRPMGQTAMFNGELPAGATVFAFVDAAGQRFYDVHDPAQGVIRVGEPVQAPHQLETVVITGSRSGGQAANLDNEASPTDPSLAGAVALVGLGTAGGTLQTGAAAQGGSAFGSRLAPAARAILAAELRSGNMPLMVLAGGSLAVAAWLTSRHGEMGFDMLDPQDLGPNHTGHNHPPVLPPAPMINVPPLTPDLSVLPGAPIDSPVDTRIPGFAVVEPNWLDNILTRDQQEQAEFRRKVIADLMAQNPSFPRDLLPAYDSHHILPLNEYPQLQGLREKFAEWGIDLNSAANGVLLPRGEGIGSETPHGDTQRNEEYKEAMLDRFKGVTTREDALEKLEQIKDELQQRKFIPPKG